MEFFVESNFCGIKIFADVENYKRGRYNRPTYPSIIWNGVNHGRTSRNTVILIFFFFHFIAVGDFEKNPSLANFGHQSYVSGAFVFFLNSCTMARKKVSGKFRRKLFFFRASICFIQSLVSIWLSIKFFPSFNSVVGIWWVTKIFESRWSNIFRSFCQFLKMAS